MKSYSYQDEIVYYRDRPPAPDRDVGPHLRTFLGDPAHVFAGKRVLDVGAGGCLYTRYVAERLAPRQIVPLDLLVHRPDRLILSNGARLPFTVGDVFRLPFAEAAFDVVMASLVLHQLPQLDAALREVRRVLRPDGTFVCWEPNPFNAVVAFRFFFKPHSKNQYLFFPWRVRPAFARAGFAVQTRYFYAKLPRTRNPLLGTCVGLIARPARNGESEAR
jgi:ubiquinone/menaquinone biosynthesis C-methylase UbiE